MSSYPHASKKPPQRIAPRKPRAQYVNGFLFDPTLSSVVLIRKNKPPHQDASEAVRFSIRGTDHG